MRAWFVNNELSANQFVHNSVLLRVAGAVFAQRALGTGGVLIFSVAVQGRRRWRFLNRAAAHNTHDATKNPTCGRVEHV